MTTHPSLPTHPKQVDAQTQTSQTDSPTNIPHPEDFIPLDSSSVHLFSPQTWGGPKRTPLSDADFFFTGGVKTTLLTYHPTPSPPTNSLPQTSEKMDERPSQVQNTIRGRYEIIDTLGQGGMGVVYLVFDPLRQRQLALKMLHSSPSEDCKTLAHELLVQESLQHDNILRTYDFDFDPQRNQLFFTMEYIEAPPLEFTLQNAQQSGPNQFQPLDDDAILDCIRQLTQALDYAHERNVIHRDLKPSNILWKPAHPLKLLDFGIAKQISNKTTHHTGLIGTAIYMAPEQLRGNRRITRAADIYSLGVITYQMLTGELYYGNMPGPHEYFVEKYKNDPAMDTRHFPPPAVDEVLLRALDAQPAQRFLSASQFYQALLRSLERKHQFFPRLQKNSETNITEGSFHSVVPPRPTRQSIYAHQLLRLEGPSIGTQELETAIRDHGPRDIARLELLRTRVDHRGLAKLKDLTNLQELDLTETPINSEGAKQIGQCYNLRKLNLTQTQLGRFELKQLQKLRQLETLNLWGNPIESSSLGALHFMKSLQTLVLCHTNVNDQVGPYLEVLPRLEALYTGQTCITKRGQKSLAQRFPRCSVIF